MEKKKYELVMDDSINVDGHILYRIRALQSFNDVKFGNRGGYIESEDNLSQEGNCWLYGDSKCYDKATVKDNARLFHESKAYENASIFGNARLYDHSQVYGSALIYTNATLFDHSSVYGCASIADFAHLYGYSSVSGHAKICNSVTLSGAAHIHGEAVLIMGTINDLAEITSNDDYFCVTDFEQSLSITAFRCDNGIKVTYGPYTISLFEFQELVKTKPKKEKYLLLIQLIKTHFNIKGE